MRRRRHKREAKGSTHDVLSVCLPRYSTPSSFRQSDCSKLQRKSWPRTSPVCHPTKGSPFCEGRRLFGRLYRRHRDNEEERRRVQKSKDDQEREPSGRERQKKAGRIHGEDRGRTEDGGRWKMCPGAARCLTPRAQSRAVPSLRLAHSPRAPPPGSSSDDSGGSTLLHSRISGDHPLLTYINRESRQLSCPYQPPDAHTVLIISCPHTPPTHRTRRRTRTDPPSASSSSPHSTTASSTPALLHSGLASRTSN